MIDSAKILEEKLHHPDLYPIFFTVDITESDYYVEEFVRYVNTSNEPFDILTCSEGSKVFSEESLSVKEVRHPVEYYQHYTRYPEKFIKKYPDLPINIRRGYQGSSEYIITMAFATDDFTKQLVGFHNHRLQLGHDAMLRDLRKAEIRNTELVDRLRAFDRVSLLGLIKHWFKNNF
ncbi:hypothetical protein NVP1121O_161 [Vibrio phage 1.121.O._10N.286.46.C4]|nr:hypothetical protein NVP1121O_161 [Vibrio phage 1.121.O._10N.286.46.C4]